MYIETFQKYMMPPTAIDKFDPAILQSKFDAFGNKPIQFTLLGFPFKSINTRDKTLGDLPDYGEELSINHLGKMVEDFKAIHPAGAKLKIISDGYMFNHLMDVPDSTVDKYERIVKEMASADIEVLDPWDFYEGDMNSIRDRIMKQFGITSIELEKRILFDVEVKALYQGMIRFMHDDLAIRNYNSGNQLHKAAKAMARDMMLWNEAYSTLIRTELTEPLGAIRLSMHPSENIGKKYSINLINAESHQSPWHSCVVVRKDGSITTMKRKDCENFRLIFKNNQPYYYEA